MTTEDLIKFAKRCRRFEKTHGELPVLHFGTCYGTVDEGVGREGTGLSYLDIARAFEELAALRTDAGPSCDCGHKKEDHGFVCGPQEGCFKCGCWGFVAD